MWKMSFLAIILATVFLGGCNWGNKAVEERPAENVKNDVQRGVDKVEDVVEPARKHDVYNRDVNGTVMPEATTPGTTVPRTTAPGTTTPGTNTDLNGTNGYNNVPNANGVDRNGNVIKEKVVEEKVDVRENNNMNTR
ncbi:MULTISPECIES: hypothetical protein [Lysinibacillus]|uniref:hypothetical protein n=1 Tax=Lysinibacillus TaxID=400634 RepID=UPI001CBE5B60|nr:hypothetical protein [Lysinibacillus sphaericus]